MSTDEEALEEATEENEIAFVDMADYRPFIADVRIGSFAAPFPITDPDMRTDWQIEKARRRVRGVMRARKFDPPVPLADFCLIAHEKWRTGDGDPDPGPEKLCLLL
jgi:hypothetical protein